MKLLLVSFQYCGFTLCQNVTCIQIQLRYNVIYNSVQFWEGRSLQLTHSHSNWHGLKINPDKALPRLKRQPGNEKEKYTHCLVGKFNCFSGPRTFDPSQKQSKGVIITQGIRPVKIWKRERENGYTTTTKHKSHRHHTLLKIALKSPKLWLLYD